MVELDAHLRPFDGQGPGGADSRTGSAVSAHSCIALDVLVGCMYQHPLVFEISNPFIIVLSRPRQFHDHDALFAGEDGRFKNIESEIEFTGKKTDDRFFDF
jgi:hypothetical protein